MNKNKIILYTLIAFIIFGFLIYLGSGKNSNKNKNLNDRYETFKVRDLSIGETGKRYQYQVHVNKPTEIKTLKQIAKEVLEDAKIDTPFNALAIHFYNDPNATGNTNGQVIYAPNGEWADYSEVSTSDYSNMSFSYRNLKPVTEEVKEDKFGLTIEERKQVYFEIVKAEDKAYKEAEEVYPTDGNKVNMETARNNLDKNIEKERELIKKYKSEVRDKWRLTEEQMKDIGMEGVSKKWPTPELN